MNLQGKEDPSANLPLEHALARVIFTYVCRKLGGWERKFALFHRLPNRANTSLGGALNDFTSSAKALRRPHPNS